MLSLKVNILLITLTTCICATLLLKKNPFTILVSSLKYILKDRKSLALVILLFAILALNKIQLKVENILNVKNYAIYFYQIEGELLYSFQTYFYNPLLTFILTYFYVIVFTSMLIVSLFIYSYYKDKEALRAFALAIMLNYLLALPFFMFFNVAEVWYIHPEVKFLIPNIYPNFELEYRKVSGLYNCFPSLHTSISISMVLIAYSFNYKKFGQILLCTAGVILFSIIYLGIHWLADMIAGLLLALLSVKLAVYLVQGRWRQLKKAHTKSLEYIHYKSR